MSKERPILFSGAMVRAILAGTKTQTRRVVKPQPDRGMVIQGVAHLTHGMDPAKDGGVWYDTDCISAGREFSCPYGQPSDRLWVRETWGIYDGEGMAYHYKDGIPKQRPRGFHVSYPADDDSGIIGDVFKWRPSIHMPRWASRILLEIESVRVERLLDISEEDATAEGFPGNGVDGKHIPWSARGWFEALWDTINGVESRKANPWVWVVTFKRITPSAEGRGV